MYHQHQKLWVEDADVIADELHNTIRALPKIELHRHLEGSMRLKTLVSIAVEHGITLPRLDIDGLRPFVQVMPGETRSWRHFLGKFDVLRQFYRSEAIIKRVTHEVIADAAEDNVRYMELRFTPQALNNLIHCDLNQIVAWVCEASREACQGHDIDVRLIVSVNRHESLEIGERALAAALLHRDNGVVGLDLAGREAEVSGLAFRDLFAQAKAEGLGVTIHAGEWAGADSVRAAVEVFNAERVGHGVRAVEDPSVVALLAERGVTLEVCPTSNYHSGVVDDLRHHPLADLYRRHVKTTINTDDPLVSDLTLSTQIAQILASLPLTLDDIKRHTLTAAEAAFLPADERAALVTRFQAALYPIASI